MVINIGIQQYPFARDDCSVMWEASFNSYKKQILMKTNTLCTICQQPCTQIICDTCQSEWDQTASWIQDLKMLEEHYREITRDDDEVIAFHIDPTGHIRKSRHLIWKTTLGEDFKYQAKEDANKDLIEDIQLWATKGGLTTAEYAAIRLMKAGLTGSQAADVINEDEGKHVTAYAYHNRVEIAIKKIRRAFVNYAED